MNPIKEIGRYRLPIGSVTLIERRTGWKGLLKPGWNIHLSNGMKLCLTDAEKLQLDEELDTHSKVMEVLSMINHQQSVNHPH